MRAFAARRGGRGVWITPWLLVAVAVGVLIAASSGLAASRGTDPTAVETVFACVQNGNGQLRAVTDPSHCGQNNNALSWLARSGVNVALPQVGDAFATSTGVVTIPFGAENVPVAHLDLQAGTYLLLAKLVVDTGLDFPVIIDANCQLTAESDSDFDRIAAEAHTIFGAAVPASLMLTHTFTDGGRATVTCANPNSGTFDGEPVDLTAENIRLTALAIGNLTNS